MNLLSPEKVKRVSAVEADENMLRKVSVERKRLEEEKRISELNGDWEPEKKKAWKDFCSFNKELQQKKAVLLVEVEELEAKKERLIENLQVYISE